MGELAVPTFPTPQPIVATIEVAAGSVRVSASERADTEVEVRARDPGSAGDAEAAAQTRVEYADGRLSITGPKRPLLRSLIGVGPAIEVDLSLPEGSELDATGWADYVCTGRLGAVALEKSAGVRIERAARVRANSSMGDIVVGRIDGHADLTTAMGKIRVGALGGAASLKTSAGDLSVGEVTAAVRLKTAYGDIGVDRALASVNAKTSAGSVRIGEAAAGTIELETAYGELDIGVPDGVAAYLDVSSGKGTVRSELDASAAPADADARRTVEIRGHTQFGGIVIRRA
jgi:putative adhesin